MATLTCPGCDKGFPKIKALQKHQRDTKHGLNHCPGCNRIFYTLQALQQHQKNTGHPEIAKQKVLSEKTKKIPCPQCSGRFMTSQALEQHRRKKHGPPPDNSPPLASPSSTVPERPTNHPLSSCDPKPGPKQPKVVEKPPLWERIVNHLRRLIHWKKVLILDEMLGKGSSIPSSLNLPHEIRPLPAFLKGFPDRDLRLALAQQRWGLITRDFEMALLAFKMKIRPVYFLAERRGNTVLIRLSRSNLQFMKSTNPLKETSESNIS